MPLENLPLLDLYPINIEEPGATRSVLYKHCKWAVCSVCLLGVAGHPGRLRQSGDTFSRVTPAMRLAACRYLPSARNADELTAYTQPIPASLAGDCRPRSRFLLFAIADCVLVKSASRLSHHFRLMGSPLLSQSVLAESALLAPQCSPNGRRPAAPVPESVASTRRSIAGAGHHGIYLVRNEHQR